MGPAARVFGQSWRGDGPPPVWRTQETQEVYGALRAHNAAGLDRAAPDRAGVNWERIGRAGLGRAVLDRGGKPLVDPLFGASL